MCRFRKASGIFPIYKTIVVILLISLALFGVGGCQRPVTPTLTTTPTSTIVPPLTPSTVPSTPTASPTPAKPAPTQTPTPSPSPSSTPTPTPPKPTVTSPPTVTLPTFVTVSSNLMGQDLHGAALAKVTAVFRFDTTSSPGFYSFSLLSGTDNFGAQQVEWYRATKQISLEWAVPGGSQAFYQLLNNAPITGIFQSQITYRKYVSLDKVPRATPSDLETAVVNAINAERNSRGLALLTWDDTLYQAAIQRIKSIGEEGQILSPPAEQTYAETAYVTTPGVNNDAFTILRTWITNQTYFGVITNPNIRAVAIRTDTYDNQKFWVVGFYK